MAILDNLEAQFIFDLTLAAYELLLEELAETLETYLIEYMTDWLHSNFNQVYKTSFQNNKLQKLQEWCSDIAAKYPNLVFDSEHFTPLMKLD